jgi:hypothetical protein
MPYTCPVCAYPGLPRPAADYEICPSCGTEFEYHDARRTHESLRREWIVEGAQWHSRVVHPPVGWNPWLQLINGGFVQDLPFIDVEFHPQFDAVVGAGGLRSILSLV